MRGKITRIVGIMLAMICLLSMSLPVQAKTYITSKKAGLKTTWYTQHYQIVSIKGNTVKYRSAKLVEGVHDQMTVVFGKDKTAKLTSSTKYYIGTPSRYSGNGCKWIYKTTKKTFKKNLTGKEWWDVIVVKKGKVQRIYTKMQIAG